MALVERRLRRRTVDDLMDEILMEILVRTQCKATHRCKCICKRWLSIISDPQFIHLYIEHHRKKSNNNPNPKDVLVILNPKLKIEVVPPVNPLKVSFDYMNNREHGVEHVIISSISNDLVVVGPWTDSTLLIICNPLTKQSFTLHRPRPDDDKGGLDMCSCVCSNQHPTLFKVVLLTKVPFADRVRNKISDELYLNMYIFSSDTGDWTRFRVPAPPNFVRFRKPHEANGQDMMTTVNGILYWCTNMIFVCNPFDDNPQQCCRFIDVPQDVIAETKRVDCRLCIANVENHLRLYLWRFITADTPTLSVWDLTTNDADNGRHTWTIKRFLDLTSIKWYRVGVSDSLPMSIKGFNPYDGDVLYVVAWNTARYRLLAVNLRSKTVQLLYKLGSDVNFVSLFPYVPPIWPTPLNNTKFIHL